MNFTRAHAPIAFSLRRALLGFINRDRTYTPASCRRFPACKLWNMRGRGRGREGACVETRRVGLSWTACASRKEIATGCNYDANTDAGIIRRISNEMQRWWKETLRVRSLYRIGFEPISGFWSFTVWSCRVCERVSRIPFLSLSLYELLNRFAIRARRFVFPLIVARSKSIQSKDFRS